MPKEKVEGQVVDPLEDETAEEEPSELADKEEAVEAATDGSEESVEEPEVDTDEQAQIAAFRMMFGSDTTEPTENVPASAPAKPVEPALDTKPANFHELTKAEYDEALESPDAFNKHMKNVYISAVTEGVQKAVNYMNQVMEQRMQMERITGEFYDVYRDLRPHKHIVKAAVEEVQRAKPKASLPELLVSAAAVARAYVTNKNGKQVKQSSAGSQSVLPTKQASRAPVKKATSPRETAMRAFMQRHLNK